MKNSYKSDSKLANIFMGPGGKFDLIAYGIILAALYAIALHCPL